MAQQIVSKKALLAKRGKEGSLTESKEGDYCEKTQAERDEGVCVYTAYLYGNIHEDSLSLQPVFI